MAETTACLRRSFSNPSEISHDLSQGDPYRALGESISFGRYMSESLAWEKWSTFTNNRYLEEAERYSKPGSVAKMKAYFEAQYGRFGARKQAAQEQANDDLSKVELEVKDTPNADVLSSSLTLDSGSVSAIDCLSVKHEFPTEETSDVDLHTSETVKLNGSAAHKREVCAVESGVILDAVKCPVEVQVSPYQNEEVTLIGTVSSPEDEVDDELDIQVQADQCQNVKADVTVTDVSAEDAVEDEHQVSIDVQAHQCHDATTDVRGSESSVKKNVVDEMDIDTVFTTQGRRNDAEKEILNPSNEQKPPEFSVKKTNKSSLSKLQSSLSRLSTPVRPKREGINTPNKSNVPKVSSSLSRLSTPQRPKRERISTPSKNNVAKESSSLVRLATPNRTKKEGNGTPYNREAAKEIIGKKKQTADSIHMSINVNSDIGFVKKPSPASRKSGVGKLFTPLGKMIRDSFVPSSTQNRASMNSCSRHPSETPLSESRRSRVALEKAFARNTTLEEKLKSPSVGNVQSSIQSPITFAPFTFRTEERALKRREIFQKKIEKEADNLQLVDKAKVNMVTDSRKSSQSMKPQSNATVYIKKERLGDNTKNPKPRSQLSKCQGKPASELAQDKSSRPPQRSAAAKTALQNRKLLPAALPIQKIRHENASPNILRG